MNISIAGQDPRIMTVEGRVDASSSPELDRQLCALSEAGTGTIILDLSGIKYLSSSGLRVLLLAHRRQQRSRGRLVLRNVSAKVAYTLQLCGFDRLFEFSVTSSTRPDQM